MVLANLIFTCSLVFKRNISSITTSITKIHRGTYHRVYPAMLVLPNGATIQIRYPVPRLILKLPLDVNTLSENEKRIHLDRRKPKKKTVTSSAEKIHYDPSKYINLIQKKK